MKGLTDIPHVGTLPQVKKKQSKRLKIGPSKTIAYVPYLKEIEKFFLLTIPEIFITK